MYLRTEFLRHKRRYFSVLKYLVVLTEIDFVYSENYTKHIMHSVEKLQINF
jgi:hypothetical protein